jgi:methyl-accepting chemotaxis protein
MGIINESVILFTITTTFTCFLLLKIIYDNTVFFRIDIYEIIEISAMSYFAFFLGNKGIVLLIWSVLFIMSMLLIYFLTHGILKKNPVVISGKLSVFSTTIEKTASETSEMSIKTADDSAEETSILVEMASRVSKIGKEQVDRMFYLMDKINREGGRLKKIIGMIDDITFQADICLLNAVVEAVKTCDPSLRFGVVSDGFKCLMSESTYSLKETTGLTGEQMKGPGNGSDCMQRIYEDVNDLVSNINKVSDILKKVRTASMEQDKGFNRVKKAILRLDEAVQSACNAKDAVGSSEELATMVESLNATINHLAIIVRRNG